MDFQFLVSFLSHIKIFAICITAFAISATITWIVRLYSLHKAILDIPNERSSHHIPTPRGGGIAIILTFISFILGLGYVGYIESNLVWALTLGGIAIGVVGYCDDIYSIKIRWRISVHFFAAIVAVYWLGGFSILDFSIWKISLHWLGSFITVLGIVWCINLYNFMDGIDGLSGSEGIFIGIATGMALWLVGAHQLALVLWLLASVIAGFIVWNWPPAKIFLGDAGSGFLGFIFSALGLYTINKGFLPFSFWWVISAIFLCDATLTLLSRMYQRKRWYSAHREHAFQNLIDYGANHTQVTAGILLVNCCLLFPAAFATLYWPNLSSWFMWGSSLCLFLTWLCIKSLCSENFRSDLEISPPQNMTETNYLAISKD